MARETQLVQGDSRLQRSFRDLQKRQETGLSYRGLSLGGGMASHWMWMQMQMQATEEGGYGETGRTRGPNRASERASERTDFPRIPWSEGARARIKKMKMKIKRQR